MHDGRAVPAFNKALKKADGSQAPLLRKEIRDVMKAPRQGSVGLEGKNYRGLRRSRRGKFRLMFAICGACRDLALQDSGTTAPEKRDEIVGFLGCSNCVGTDDETVVFFTADLRKRVYDSNVPQNRQHEALRKEFQPK